MIKTVDDRYMQVTASFRLANGAIETYPMYSYESTKALFDVLVANGQLLVRTNMGRWSNIVSDWKPQHYAICAHYALIKPE